MLIYIGLFVPFQISFPLNEPDILFYFDICVDSLFIVDFFVNLNTGFYRRGKKIMKRKQIFLDYAKFWFWIDLISSIPFTWFLEGFSNNENTGGSSRAPKLVKLMKISKILKILKLLRLMKLKKLMERFDDYFVSYQSDFILTFSFILIKILIFIHYMGCVFYYAGDYS